MAEPRRNSPSAFTLLTNLIDPKSYVGEVYSLSYDEALIQIQDANRSKVGGLPALSFLIATRVSPQKPFNPRDEDSSVVLLRVIDKGEMPTDAEFTRLRVMGVGRTADNPEVPWDDETVIDPILHRVLSYGGIRCRVLGTFYIDEVDGHEVLAFGSDLSNYYPNRGLKVFKLRGLCLENVVNYRRPGFGLRQDTTAYIGKVRYTSTNHPLQDTSDVHVAITPTDLLSQRTALFGMTRTGKSNTTKIIVKSIFQLRWLNNDKIGQLIFDPNGEYANDNFQDRDTTPGAIKGIWACAPSEMRSTAREEIVVYGTVPHKDDPERKLMNLNFYSDINLQTGKNIIDDVLASDTTKYVSNFRDVSFKRVDGSELEDTAEFKRRALFYRTLLFKAGFTMPKDMRPDTRGLFENELLEVMAHSKSQKGQIYKRAANLLARPNISWNQLIYTIRDLYDFIRDRNSGFNDFDNMYVSEHPDQTSWADEDLMKILEMFRYGNGPSLIGRVKDQHGADQDGDYADEIYNKLKLGNLVIVDQSSGDIDLNRITAERIMRRIFEGNQSDFVIGVIPKGLLIYIEEAHNLLPSAESKELSNIWVRTAKEGAKYGIGMVYATQEVSSIQRNVLRNTTNWFVGHLNNTDEIKELDKFYDFSDFDKSILRADERGFLRMKTLSNPYIIPVQISKFTIS